MTEPPERAPRLWFTCYDYGSGLHVDRVAADEAAALQAAFAHLQSGANGTVKVGYHSWRSRVIVYSEAELLGLMRGVS